MKLFRRVFSIVVLLSLCSITFGQTDGKLTLVTSAEDYTVQERVLLLPDQELYLAGEHINFFALTFDAALQIPIDLSAVLYVELFDPSNHVISAKKYRLKQGRGVYDIELPRQSKTGYYYLRAYTNYMKNFGAGVFFTKRLKVVNPFLKASDLSYEEPRKDSSKLDINAEGGKMVYGLENRVSFTISANEPVLARLYENDSLLAEKESTNGFGIFTFTPSPENSYRIEAASQRGKASVELHSIGQTGVICKLDSIKDQTAFVTISAKGEVKFPLSLMVKNNGLLYKYSQPVNSTEELLQLELPVGLNTLSVIDNSGLEVSQRLVYIEPKSSLTIAVQPSNTTLAPTDSLVLHITSDAKKQVNYLVAINLGDSATSPAIHDMIKSSAFVSSVAQLTNRWTVNAMDYFSNKGTNLNDFILTIHDTTAANNYPNKMDYLPEISEDIVSGRIIRTIDQSPASGMNTYLSFIDSICWINRCKTNSEGRFVTTLPIEHQAENLVITVFDSTNHYAIHLDDEFYPHFLPISEETFYPDSSLRETILSRMINLQVNDAYADQHQRTSTSRSVLRFYGDPVAEYKFRKYVNLPFVDEFIFEIVEEVMVDRRGKQQVVNVKNSANKSIGDNPLVIVDGVPLLRTNSICRLPSEKLESMRVLNTKFFWGDEVYDGVIDLTSNSKSFDLLEMEKNATRVSFCPVTTGKRSWQTPSSRIPRYISDIYFNEIKTLEGDTLIKVHLPQNAGCNSLSVVGYTPTGEWGYLSLPKLLTITK